MTDPVLGGGRCGTGPSADQTVLNRYQECSANLAMSQQQSTAGADETAGVVNDGGVVLATDQQVQRATAESPMVEATLSLDEEQ